jgi:hypothetical protein
MMSILCGYFKVNPLIGIPVGFALDLAIGYYIIAPFVFGALNVTR